MTQEIVAKRSVQTKDTLEYYFVFHCAKAAEVEVEVEVEVEYTLRLPNKILCLIRAHYAQESSVPGCFESTEKNFKIRIIGPTLENIK